MKIKSFSNHFHTLKMNISPSLREAISFMKDVLVVNPDGYVDDYVDPIVFEVKNFKNVSNSEPSDILSAAIQVLLDRCNLHKYNNNLDAWHDLIRKEFQKFNNLWSYVNNITEPRDRCQSILDLYEYCQNEKRPHLQKGFYQITTSLQSGSIFCVLSTEQFCETMERSEEIHEKETGKKLRPYLSRSCPW